MHFLLLLASLFVFSACQSRANMTDYSRFPWLPTVSAPSAFPVRVIQGALLLADTSELPLPSRVVVANGWGKVGPLQLVGEEMKALPVQLAVTWLSYAEDQIYRAKLDIPSHALSRQIAESNASSSTGRPESWDRVIVGLAPKGTIFVWIAGEAGTRLVATGSGSPIDLEWGHFSDGRSVSREEHVLATLREELGEARYAQLLREGIPANFWNRANRQHAIDLTVVGGASRDSVWIDHLNGERGLKNLQGARTQTDERQSLPKRLLLRWTAHEGQRYSSTIELDPLEALSAFEKLTIAQPSERLLMLVDLSDAPDRISVTLRSGQLVLPLQLVTVAHRQR